MNVRRIKLRWSSIALLILVVLIGKPFSASAQTFSARSGWGSTPYYTGGTGVTFRVWAPNASSVRVFTFTAPVTNVALVSEGASGVWSVDVDKVVTNQEYKYRINGTTYKQDPRARKQISSTGNSIVYNPTNFSWAGDTFTGVPINDAVVYELNIGTFNDTGGGPGTFITATNRLPYLKQLGISAVEVMPINEFPGDYSWGYNPSDIFGVESAFGGPDGFKAFVKACHQQGIAVFLDVLHNHYGGNDLDLWQYDLSYVSSGGTNYGGIYFYQVPGHCCTQWGGPRPNFGTQQVRNFIQDNFRMWLDEYRVDGFRWDSPGTMLYSDAGFISDAQTLIQQISSMIHTSYTGKINIGEDQDWLSGTSGFDSTWYNGSSFQYNIVGQLTPASDASRNMNTISAAINEGDGGWGNVLFTETHDSAGDLNGGQRLPVYIDGGNPTSLFARKRSTLGAVLALTSPGIPMILQGQEMLTTTQFGADEAEALVWSRTNTYSGIVSLYTDLIRLRRNLDSRSSGLKGANIDTIFLADNNSNNNVVAYRRWSTGSVGDDVVVVANFANTSWTNYNVSGFPKTGVWYTQFNSDWTKYSSDYGNFGSLSTTVSVSTATLNLPPYSALILSQNVPGAPSTPQNLTASTAGTNQISLVWNASGGATGYIVKRGGTQIATTSVTNYLNTGLDVGAQYCYTVLATNIGGVSAESAQACAASLPATGSTNLLAVWTLDEGSGVIAYDSSGNSNTGTVSGSSWTWTSGLFGSAFYFGGQDQVAVSNSASLNPVQGLTVSAWVNADGWWNQPRILEKGKSSNQYALFLNGSGQLSFVVYGVTNGTLVTTPPSEGAWHHLAGTYDGSVISLYIDGQVVTQRTATGQMPITTDPLAIGFKPNGNLFNSFQGAIDDVRLYGSALTSNQIAQLYAPAPPASLTAIAAGTNETGLAWSSSAYTDLYIIKRGGTPIATTTATNYTDSGLGMGVQYCYTVAGSNSFGVSADSTQACVTIPFQTSVTNLLAYWTFNEGSDTITYDSSGNSNTGTVSGSWYWTSGMFASALYFSAPTQVAVSNSASLNPVQGLTVSAWVNADYWSGNQRILEKGTSNNQYALFINPSTQLVFAVYGVTGGTAVTAPPSEMAWHHVAGTYNGSLISLYIDGQIATQQTATGQMPITTDPLAIGYRPGANIFYYFNGTIDDVRIYGSALSGNQVAQLYQADTVGDGIANWWRQTYFGSGSATDALSCATCDVDGTGQNNLFKYVAGLNPWDATSVFTLQLSPVVGQPNQMSLTFKPIANGRTYTTQGSASPSGGSFSDLTSTSGPQTNGNQVTITDLNAAPSNEFYRIRISYP
jgi:1,4-alpha-glucan branching enzyme